MGSACVSQRSLQAQDRTFYLQPLPRRKKPTSQTQLAPAEATSDELPDLVKDLTPSVPEKVGEPAVKPPLQDSVQIEFDSVKDKPIAKQQPQLGKVLLAHSSIVGRVLHARRRKKNIKKQHLQKYKVQSSSKMPEDHNNEENHEPPVQQEDLDAE